MNAFNDIARPLPACSDSEKAVLSCLMQAENRAEILTHLAAELFHVPAHQLLYSQLAGWEGEFDVVEMNSRLLSAKIMDQVGGPAKIMDIYGFVPTANHAPHYIDILIDKAARRKAIAAATELTVQAYEGDDINTTCAKFCEEIVSQVGGQKEPSWEEQLAEWLEHMEDLDKGGQVGPQMRWPCFNEAFGGLPPNYIVLGGATSSGKSTLLQNIVEDVVQQSKRVLWFSYEMSAVDHISRLAVSVGKVRPGPVFKGGFSSDDFARIQKFFGRVAEWRDFLKLVTNSMDVDRLCQHAKAEALRGNLGLIAVDYLQLVEGSENTRTREQEVARISRRLRQLQRSLKVPIIALSQLNENGQVRESKAIAHDSEICLRVVSPNVDEGEEGGVSIDKGRNVGRGQVLPLVLMGSQFEFIERSQ